MLRQSWDWGRGGCRSKPSVPVGEPHSQEAQGLRIGASDTGSFNFPVSLLVPHLYSHSVKGSASVLS